MGKRVELKREDDRGEPSLVERGLMLLGAAITMGLLVYLLWRAFTVPPVALPEARVIDVAEVGNETQVRVELLNNGGVGLQTVDIVVPCEMPPPKLTFEMVPAGGKRVGVVTCPAGTTDPVARVTSWVPA